MCFLVWTYTIKRYQCWCGRIRTYDGAFAHQINSLDRSANYGNTPIYLRSERDSNPRITGLQPAPLNQTQASDHLYTTKESNLVPRLYPWIGKPLPMTYIARAEGLEPSRPKPRCWRPLTSPMDALAFAEEVGLEPTRRVLTDLSR